MARRRLEESFFFPPVQERGRALGSLVDDFSRDNWVDEVVQLVPMSGRVRYLLRVKREPCLYCTYGTRTVSIWVTPQGKGEAVTWCGHCFNATCERFPLDDEHLMRFHVIREAASQQVPPAAWNAARLALEDLERRGVL